MKLLFHTTCLAFGLHTAHAAAPPTSTAQAENTPPVELPPMMVEESVSTVPWLYVSVGGTEFLSRCSESTTHDLVEAWLTKMQLLRVLLPDEMLGRMDASSVLVLYSQDLAQTVSAEIQRELQSAQAAARAAGTAREREHGVNLAPSMRIADRDTHATIAYVDESRFNGANLSVAPGHVRYLLSARVPELPAWLIEGVERLWRRADFVEDPITFRPLIWENPRESDALADDATRPRALLPAGELFATEAQRTVENQHPRRLQTRAAEQELFVRWAIGTSEATRAALWKFAARAAERPATEEMFAACFGFDFAELRDRLSDYLSVAAGKMKWIDPGTLPPVPDIKVRRATPDEIARVRGEWERLAISYVQRRMPEVREPYIAQARRTLRRAYNAGDRDPRLLATMGLCEVDAGNDAGAREFLEAAVAGGVVRPRAYHELARIRVAALRRDAPERKQFSFAELAPILQPLQRATTQSPPLPEVFELLAQAWSRCELDPSPAELADVELGARLFARRPTVGYPTALVLARHGKKAEAAAVLDACAGYPADENLRVKIARLRGELLETPARSSTNQ